MFNITGRQIGLLITTRLIPAGLLLTALSGCRIFGIEDNYSSAAKSRLDSLHVSQASIALFSEEGVLDTLNYGGSDDTTQFQLASIGKILTGTAVLQLVETNMIDLYADINLYLPFPVRTAGHPADPITMHMLLTHTSGIKDNWDIIDREFSSCDTDIDPLPDLLKTCREYLSEDGLWYDRDKNFNSSSPGSKFEYSNMAISLAGLIVQEVTGIDFQQYCRENILNPLEIGGGWNLHPEDNNSISPPTDYSGKKVKTRSGSLTPAGFYTCSASDYARLMSVFINGGTYEQISILSEDSVSLMTERQFENHSYIWHFTGYTYNGEKLLFHNGGFDGIRTGVFISPDFKTGFVILCSGEYDAPFALYELVQMTLDFGRSLK